MAELEMHATLPATAEVVWAIIGDFAALADWHPMVPNCAATEDGQGRIISLPGMTVIETLIPGESPSMGHTYTVTETPMPIADYRATVWLEPVEPAGTQCQIRYKSRFTPVGVSEERAAGMLRGFFDAGFTALSARLDIAAT